MSQTTTVGVLVLLIILVMGIGALSVYVLVLIKRLQTSFTKLGYMVREDAKKYFDDASQKLIETNEQFREEYRQIVVEGTQSALLDSEKVMGKALAEAQEEAGRVILHAQETAQNIITAAKEQSKKHFYQAIENSVQAIDWTMEQYVGKTYSQENHEEIIRQLIKAYIDERD